MPRQLLTRTNTDQDLDIARGIASRERELENYDFELAHHESVIANLGHLVWDEETTPYKGMQRDVMTATARNNGASDELIQKVADLQTLETSLHGKAVVTQEIRRSEAILETLLVKLPAGDRRDAALAALAAEQAQGNNP